MILPKAYERMGNFMPCGGPKARQSGLPDGPSGQLYTSEGSGAVSHLVTRHERHIDREAVLVNVVPRARCANAHPATRLWTHVAIHAVGRGVWLDNVHAGLWHATGFGFQVELVVARGWGGIPLALKLPCGNNDRTRARGVRWGGVSREMRTTTGSGRGGAMHRGRCKPLDCQPQPTGAKQEARFACS